MNIINPVSDAEASEGVQAIYSEIASTFKIKSVPLPFRFIANNPKFLEFTWERIKAFIANSEFEKESEQLGNFSNSIINIIYSKSEELAEFISHASTEEKKELMENTKELIVLNAKLTLVFIALRESLKGVVSDNNLAIDEGKREAYHPNFYPDLDMLRNPNLAKNNTLPVLESTSPILIRFPEFYKLISQEINELIKTEKYLKSRVEIEKLTQNIIEDFSVKMKFPFEETIVLLRGHEFSQDIFMQIKNVFPSSYPNNLLTSSLMNSALEEKKEVVTH